MEYNLKNIHKHLLDLMIIFKHICEDNTLKYSLIGGTLLGAIRHRGFIPWDDDVDFQMPRPDYEKLINILSASRNLLPDGVKIITERDRSYAFPFAKIIDEHIPVIEKYKDCGVNYLWIDIFPSDGVPSDTVERLNLFERIDIERKFLGLSVARYGTGKSFARKIIKPIFIPFLKNIIGFQRIKEDMLSLALSSVYDNSKYVANVLWGFGEKEVMTRNDFETLTYLDFEGHKFKAICNWDRFLTSSYGNYMKFPSKIERNCHFNGVDMY